MSLHDRLNARIVVRNEHARRAYVGASTVGNECDAFIALTHRGFPEDPLPSNVDLIFRIGTLMEDMIIADLRSIGEEVIDRDPVTGEQFEGTALRGHMKAHLDGLMPDRTSGAYMGLECKSMAHSKMEVFVGRGLAKSHPGYVLQAQALIWLFDLPRVLVVGLDKSMGTYHSESIKRDDTTIAAIKGRVVRILEPKKTGDFQAVRRISASASSKECVECSKRGACWDEMPIEVPLSCRTCSFATPDLVHGGFHCIVTNSKAEAPCKFWERWKPEAMP